LPRFRFISRHLPGSVFEPDASLKPADPFSLDASGKSLPCARIESISGFCRPISSAKMVSECLQHSDNSDGSITARRELRLKLPAIAFLDATVRRQVARLHSKRECRHRGSLTRRVGFDFSIYRHLTGCVQPTLHHTRAQTPARPVKRSLHTGCHGFLEHGCLSLMTAPFARSG